MSYRIGIDLGGTKTEILRPARGRHGMLAPPRGHPPAMARRCRPSPGWCAGRSRERGAASVGVGIPGCISPATGLVKNANSNALNGHPFDQDLGALLAREIRVANDANCFALSEATDGAAQGCGVVFGVIIGTGCGGGIVVNGRLLEGRHRLAGEFGHTPLPWPKPGGNAAARLLVRAGRLPGALSRRPGPRL